MPRKRATPKRRVTILVNEEAKDALGNLTGVFGNTISNVAHTLLMDGFRSHVEKGHINVPGAFMGLLRPQTKLRRTRTTTSLLIKNKSQIIQQSNVIIFALEETLNYDPGTRHNQPPPDLWIDDAAYVQEIKNLVTELKRLNANLERPTPNTRQVKRSGVQLAKHFDTYLHHVAVGAGKVTVVLLAATMAGLLYQVGIDKGLVGSIWGHLKSLK
jgi:hypothetical protein